MGEEGRRGADRVCRSIIRGDRSKSRSESAHHSDHSPIHAGLVLALWVEFYP